MTRPPLSPTQQAAVEHGLADACVLAGAGSGKTRVLAERFVHLVRHHGLAVRDIAALTFTRKAAAEMRERIAAYFEAAGLATERSDVEFAAISTLHTFCARLLRLHAVEAGVDPLFGVVETGEATLLLDEAWAETEDALAADEEAGRLRFLLPGLDPASTVRALHAGLRGSATPLGAVTWAAGAGDPDAALQAVADALEAFAAWGPDVPGIFGVLHERVVADVQALIEGGPPAWSGDDARDGILATCFLPGALAGAADDIKPTPTLRGYAPIRNALVEALKTLGGLWLDALGATEVIGPLRRWLETLDAAYGRRKRAARVLDFADLEIRTLTLLEGLDARGRVPDAIPRALLVDEYQDTNPVQARILACLRRLGGALPQFAVGDPKQSIYRFRRADVSVLLAERDGTPKAGRFHLATSYRTHPELVARINAVESALFAGGTAGVDYEPLEAGGRFRPGSEAPLTVAFVGAAGRSLSEARDAEARWIADRIRTLVQEQVPRCRESGEEEAAPLRFGDMAILFRARAEMHRVEAALSEAGIPWLTLSGAGFLDAPEIEDLLHILRVLCNTADEHALAHVATGPAVAAQDADLLRWFGHREPAWDRMMADTLADGPCAPALRALAALRRQVLRGDVAAVLEGVLQDLGLLEAVRLQPEGALRAANLRKAVALAADVDLRGHHDLSALVRYLERQRERGEAESDAAVGGEGADVVRLGTIHGAKGLEYPVVFVADAGRRPPSASRSSWLLDGEGGVAVRLEDPAEGVARTPAGMTRLAEVEAQASAEESERLLYVAMTRAEERLYVSASHAGPTKKETPKLIAGWGKRLFDLLGDGLAPGERDVSLGDTHIRLETVDAEVWLEDRAPTDSDTTAGAGTPLAWQDVPLDAEAEAAARAWQASLHPPSVPLGGTRFVVSVSELLRFAASPPAYREHVLLLGGLDRTDGSPDGGRNRAHAPLRGPGAPGLASSRPENALPPAEVDLVAQDEVLRRDARLARWDEGLHPDDPGASPPSVPRDTLGRAVHRALEHWTGDSQAARSHVDDAWWEECGTAPPDEARALAAEMVARFARTEIAARLEAADTRPRRELAFHARIAFPGGARVGDLPALLVKGTIDLWLPGADGVQVVDHKTSVRRGPGHRPEEVAARYAWQMRLYALAAERLDGQDVAGASLLLLDPSWGPEAVSVPVDVGGDALRETRRLCQAFAQASLEDRWPEDWRRLLPDPG